MTFHRWLLKEAIWFTCILLISIALGFVKSQHDMIFMAIWWFTISFLLYTMKPKE